MGMPLDIHARRFYRVAYQRLEDGMLLEKLSRSKAAIYLTGYAAECMLKCLLLVVTPKTRKLDVLAEFRGGRAHDLQWLRQQLLQAGVAFPKTVRSELAYASSWSTELRYEPGEGDRSDAQRFLQSVSAILKWAESRM